jgi:hypothetical protein
MEIGIGSSHLDFDWQAMIDQVAAAIGVMLAGLCMAA